MVQIIPQMDLGQILGKSTGTGLRTGLEELLSNKIKSLTGKGEENEDPSSFFEALGENINNEGEEGEDPNAPMVRQYSPADKARAEQKFKGSAKYLEEHTKSQKEALEDYKTQKNHADILNTLAENIQYVGPTKFLNKLTPEGLEKRELYDDTAFRLIEIGQAMEGKGVMSREKLKALLKRLPSSSKTQAQNRGAIKAWAKTLKVAEPKFKEKMEELGGIQKAEKGAVLDKDIAMKFLEKAKGNKEKARTLAKMYGYKF